MAEIGVPFSNTNRPTARDVWGWVARGDVGLAAGVVGIIVLLIVPIPAFVLDMLLAISITSAVLILMTSLMIKRPLDFTAFPTVLLVTTLFRLGLGLASTRLILGHGHEGTEGAGHIIQAFGQLMMQGNYVIGVIVFAILVIVNFVVITKGSGRIAEVAARFTLDSMPGKQMAIDADLSSGLIDQDMAKLRRKELEQESTFFGSMDGAVQVRARRRRRRADHRRHQHRRRHPHRGGPAQTAHRPGGLDLHHHDHRRRPGQPGPGPGDLDRRRLPGVQGRGRGRGGQGPGHPAGHEPGRPWAWSRRPPASSPWCPACP